MALEVSGCPGQEGSEVTHAVALVVILYLAQQRVATGV